MMKLTASNYFSTRANRLYMSVSQFKSMERCPHAALAEINGKFKREKTTALLVGSFVDAWAEGTLEAFKAENPEIFKRDGSLKAEYIQAEAIIERIKRDRLFMKYLSGEKQVIMTGVINGVAVKIKIDSLLPDRIVDLKIVKDFENISVEERGALPWWSAWNYELQGAVYQEIVRQNIGKRLPFYLAAATKEKETDIDIVHIDQETLDFAMDHFTENVSLYDAIKKKIIPADRCEKCDYCKRTKKLKIPTESTEFYF